MSNTTTTEAATVDQSTADGAATETGAESAAVTEGATALGDAGKKALDAMKAERNEAKAAAKQAADDLAALRAQVEGREAEHKATLDAQRVKDEALSAANQRIRPVRVRGRRGRRGRRRRRCRRHRQAHHRQALPSGARHAVQG